MPVQKYRGKPTAIKFPCYASLKLDGELTYLIVKNHKALTMNKPRYGKLRFDFPAVEEAKILPDGIYLGELYWNEGKTIKDFHGFLAHKTDDRVQLGIWGVLEFQNEREISTERNYEILWFLRTKLLSANNIGVVPFWRVAVQEQLDNLVIEYGDWEGLVIRNLDAVYRNGQSVQWIKIKKPSRDVEAKASERTNNLARIIYLIGRELDQSELVKVENLQEGEVLRIDNFKIAKKGTSWLITKLH